VWPVFEYRHPGRWAAVRGIAAVWLVFLGSLLCGNGYWWGSLLFVAALHLALAYRLLATSGSRLR